ncbi:MAG: RluA family pseudouridine synthase [Mariprofundaceae bacterium]|nr:RluA family pseudouridine synthase [Mariprofundaceae bacterium]
MNSAQKTLSCVIPEHMMGQRLDYALTCLSDLSRSRIQALLKHGCVVQSNRTVSLRASTIVCVGDTFSIDLPDNRPMALIPEDIALDILHEDEYLLVVNKPPGMVVHPSHGHDTGTLVHALLHHCESLPGINGVERPGIVHRIDKDTSGSLVVAKTEATHHGLVTLFTQHDVDRQYIAWCRGVSRWNQKRIEQPIARHPQHRQKMAIVPTGKMAITDAIVERRFAQQFSRMRLTLYTGRTHQIRVHLAAEGMPILGDVGYARSFNPKKSLPEMTREALTGLQRQALHAEVLGFIHPITQEKVFCTAPLPDDLLQLNAALAQLLE